MCTLIWVVSVVYGFPRFFMYRVDDSNVLTITPFGKGLFGRVSLLLLTFFLFRTAIFLLNCQMSRFLCLSAFCKSSTRTGTLCLPLWLKAGTSRTTPLCRVKAKRRSDSQQNTHTHTHTHTSPHRRIWVTGSAELDIDGSETCVKQNMPLETLGSAQQDLIRQERTLEIGPELVA